MLVGRWKEGEGTQRWGKSKWIVGKKGNRVEKGKKIGEVRHKRKGREREEGGQEGVIEEKRREWLREKERETEDT